MNAEIATHQPEPQKADALAAITTDLEPESATSIRHAFGPIFDLAAEWTRRAAEIKVTSIDQKREMKLARESRLAVRDARLQVEANRKRLKESIVRRGKAIDGAANVLKDLLEPIEIYLLEQETFAARHEAARKDALRSAREEALRALGTDPKAFANLGETDETTWESVLQTAKDAQAAKLQAEKEAEEVRLEAERIAAEKREAARQEKAKQEAERVERERAQAAENARLAEQAAAEKAERERAEEEARKARAEQERAERELAAERERRAEEERKAAEQERLAAERERQAAEAREAAKLAAERAAALAPDREKLAAFAAALRGLPVPELTTEAGVKARSTLEAQLEKFARWVEKTGAEL